MLQRCAGPIVLGLLALCACHPPQKEVDALRQQVASMAAEHDQMRERVAELEAEQQELDRRQDDVRWEVQQARAIADQAMAERDPEPAPPPERPRPGRPDPAVTYKVEIGDAHARGPDTALVTLVEWSDFQCPFCGRVQTTLDQLEKNYGKKLRIVYKHNPLPFHQQALPAALAAEAAGRQGKFWPMHDLLFENQRELDEKAFVRFAKKLKLDVRQFKKDMSDLDIQRKVERQQAQGNTLGARGTPAFFVNGRFLSGAQPLESFSDLIDEELSKARRLVDSGVPAEQVYEKTIEHGKTEP